MPLLPLIAIATLLALPAATVAQSSPTRPLAQGDFDSWRAIASPRLSNDGAWLAYSFMPQDADGDLILREISSGREYRVPVGDLPPPPERSDEENPEAPPTPRNIRIAFTSDGRFAIATTFPPKSLLADAKRKKTPADSLPKEGLVIVRLSDGEVTHVENVRSLQVPAKGGAWLAYLKNPPPAQRRGDPDAGETAPPGTENAEEDTDESSQERNRPGELVLRDLNTGAERTFPQVREYTFARDGRTLLFAAAGADTGGVFAVTPGDSADPLPLLKGSGRHSRIVWNRAQTQAAFLSELNPAGKRSRALTAWLWHRGEPAARPAVHTGTPGLPADLTLSSRNAPAFTRTGERLLLAAAPPRQRRENFSTLPEDKVSADLWHWRDDHVQPMQKVRATQERNRSYRGLYDPATDRYTQIADPSLATVSFTDDGAFAVGQDNRSYRRMGDYDGRYSDIYVVNTSTGARTLLLHRVAGQGIGRTSGEDSRLSPGNRHALLYHDADWHLVDLATAAIRNATAPAAIRADNELEDRPETKPAYGTAGWAADSQSALIYDRYDIWQIFTDGRPARNLTAGHGRATRTIYRLQRLDPPDDDDDSERGLDLSAPLVLRGESEDTRATGFFRLDPTRPAAPDRLLWADANHRHVARAADRDLHLLTISRFDRFPDLHLVDSTFSSPRRLTSGGDQLAPYTWGSAELLDYRSADGRPLRATLYKPANFDVAKKYPLIVYLYERLTQNFHNFVPPAPSQNINASYYTSNGYLVLMPDIHYRTGHPGASALNCVLPAINAAVAQGGVDEQAIGIQGHSWGGYQAAFMITRTPRFRAAAIGAPVANMTSAYSGIRWGSGAPRQFQYETGQSRLGRPLHEAPELYLENSPLFHLSAVTTPALILHNDADDAVPWYQGIELFLGLRRLEKPAWLINYNGAPHGLRRRAEQHDYTRRMFQFFDHHLRGAPAPAWLENGVPYLDRDAEKLRFQNN